jgi:hypothetical protein
MKQQGIIAVTVFLILAAACSSTTPQQEKEKHRLDSIKTINDSIRKADSLDLSDQFERGDLARIDTIAVGDMNGDGREDTAIIFPHNVVNHFKLDSQYVEIKFSCKMPPLFHYSGFHGTLINVGDLDGNHTCELLYWPAWYQSNDGLLYVYGFRHNQWELFASGNIRADIVGESNDEVKFLRSRVKKIDNKSFRFIVHSWCDGSIVDSTKIIRIK